MYLTRTNRHTLLFILFFLPANSLLYAQSSLSPKKPAFRFDTVSLSYFKTADKRLPFKTVMNRYAAGEFRLLKQKVLNAGIPDQFYWIHFYITNPEDAGDSFIINIDNSRLNEMELFEVTGTAVKSLGKSGDFYPFSRRTFPNKNFIYEISMSHNQKKEYFLFVNQVGHAFVMPVKIYTSKSFQTATFKDYLFDGVTYGILLFVAVLSFMFLLASKRYLYLYYSLYIITAIAWFLSYFGLGYQYFWGKYPALNTSMAPLMACANVLLNLQICQILLKLSKTNSPLNDLIVVIKFALVFIGVFPLFFNLNQYGYGANHNYLIVFLFTILFAMTTVSFCVIYYAIKGFVEARLYLVASLLKAGSIIHLALLELGAVSASYNMEGLLQIGIFIEITLLTYALAARYTNLKVKTFVRVIEAHEKERSIISKEIHDSISNSLTGINYWIKNFTKNTGDMAVEKKEQLEKIFQELDKVQLEARSISHNTMPDYIKNSSISEIAEKYINEVQNKARDKPDGKNSIEINFSANEQLVNFSQAVKLNIFRIMQEILTNVLKHSKATNADIVFSFSKKEIIIIAEDNGTGIRGKNDGNNGGMGLKNIRTRVELLDGSFIVKSPAYKKSSGQIREPGNFSQVSEFGTMIRIRIPYRNNLLTNATVYDY